METSFRANRTNTGFVTRHHEMVIWEKKPIKAFINLLAVSWERRWRKEKLQGLPFILYYEPTTFCNLKCPSCPTGTGLLDRPREMASPEYFQKTIDALADQVFTLNMYNWGEPLLHKSFSSMVKYATEKGIVVNASSNLSMPLSALQCEEIVRSGLHSLKVGIDGASASVHAIYRRGSNLEVVHNNLHTLVSVRQKLQSSTPVIKVAYHVFAHNEKEIEEFSRQMAKIGVDAYSTTAAWLPPDGAVSKPNDPRYDMYRAVNHSIARLRSRGKNLRPCSWLYYASVINPGGSISPCCGVVSESSDFGRFNSGGTAVETGARFQAEWNGDKYKAARKLFGGGMRVARWSLQTLRDLQPDGMAFSTKESPMICAQCPIPHTLDQWSRQVFRIYRRFLRLTGQCVRSLDFQGAAVNAAKTCILRLAAWLQ